MTDIPHATSVHVDQLQALHTLVRSIGARHRLEHVLEATTRDLAGVMQVQATSVKLLSDDGTTLNYAATWGLGEKQWANKDVVVERSPLNRRLVEGEPFVTGEISQRELFQFGEGLAAQGIRSVLFTALKVDGRVIGVLGAYCGKPDRFSAADVAFMQVAAGLVAIAIENARAYQAMKRLMEDRSRFMWRVAHNLRAPLAAIVSMLDVVRNGHLGPLSGQQPEFLRRVDRRVRSMASMIDELMLLARSADPAGQSVSETALVDLGYLAGRLHRTFEQEAAQRNLLLEIQAPEGRHTLRGDQALLEQLLENLVSNALKYTPAGKVTVRFVHRPTEVRIEVIDTGIGIPAEALPQVWNEFYRAPNARGVESFGTGLGLALVAEVVARHRGSIDVQSVEGVGSTFRVVLPSDPDDGSCVP